MHSLPVLISGGLLGVFGILGAGLVGLSHDSTAERIAQNERESLVRQLQLLVPAGQFDNDMSTDFIEVSASEQLGTESTRIYRARRAGQTTAVVLSPILTQGYSGGIRLIVAVRRDGRLAGVRVLGHRETPGLGDKIEAERSDWILGFAGKSLVAPTASAWKVKRDGGVFDQFTGATITPRAVVRGVKAGLEYVRENEVLLFAEDKPTVEKNDE